MKTSKNTGLRKSTSGLKSGNGLKKAKPILKRSAISKKPKKNSISSLKTKADKLFSLANRLRFAEWKNNDWWVTCVTCDDTKPLSKMQNGHFMSRRFNATRFSEENCAPQCYTCNVVRYGEQYKFGQWIDDMYGDGTAKRLQKEAHQPHPFTREELEQVISDSKQEIAFYQNGVDSAQSQG